MASICKQKGRRFWYARYRDAQGIQHLVSTKIEHAPPGADPKERNQKAAENRRHAMEFAQRLEAAERGDAVESHLRKLVSDISERVNRRRIEFQKTDVFLEDWLERAERTRTPSTMARYRSVITLFLKSLGPKRNAVISDITADDVQKFFSSRLKGGRTANTVMLDAKVLGGPFGLALKQGLILTNPVAQAERPKGEAESRKPFPPDEVASLLSTAKGEWKTAIMLGAFAGLRLGDACGLRWSNVDLPQKILRLRAGKTKRKKKDLIIPLHPTLEAQLMELPTSDDPQAYLTPTLARAKIGGRSGLSRQFQDIMSKAGIDQETIEAEGAEGRKFNMWTFHSLRHSYVTALEAAGVAPDLRMKLAGHTDARSHARYTHSAIETLREAISKIPEPTK